jgi:hypothetical protein
METTSNFSQKIKWNPEKKEFNIYRVTKTFNYDKLHQRKLGMNPIETKTEWLPLSTLGTMEPKKAVELDILIVKNAVDSVSLEPIKGYFKAKLSLKVLSDAIYVYQYIVKSSGRAFINNLKSGQCCPIPLNGSQAGISKEFLGVEQRITVEEAKKLIADNILCYEKSGEGYRLLI